MRPLKFNARERDDLRPLIMAARKLVRTEMGTLARERARRALRTETKRLLVSYPQAVTKGAVGTSPLCGIPLRSWISAQAHFLKNHLHNKSCCELPINTTSRGWALHFASLNAKSELKEHLVLGASEATFGGK